MIIYTLGVQLRDINGYFQQQCHHIGLFMSVQLWGFTLELNPTWNVATMYKFITYIYMDYNELIGMLI